MAEIKNKIQSIISILLSPILLVGIPPNIAPVLYYNAIPMTTVP
jgi:hypothetical protein